MSTLKDLADIISQLSCNIGSRRFVNEIEKIKNMIVQIQSDQTVLVEKRIELMRENEELRKIIDELNKELVSLKCAAVSTE